VVSVPIMTFRGARNLPARSAGARRGATGFTAVEMLVVISIVAALAAIAMPSFFDFTVNQRLRTASYDLIADLSFTRGEAVKRNANVTIARVGSSWAGGWSVTDANGNVLRTHAPLDRTVVESTGPVSVTFALDGHQVGAASATFTFDDQTSKATIQARKIVLDPSGRPRSS
jgi:type IV fimbrial biogenesis protein FimT